MLRWDFFVQIQPKRASKRINAEKCKKTQPHFRSDGNFPFYMTRIVHILSNQNTQSSVFFLLYSQLLTWHHLPRSSVPEQTYPYSTYSLENFHPRPMMKNKYCVKPDKGDIQHFRDVMNGALGY